MLDTEPNIAAPEDAYEAPIDAHRGFSPERSAPVDVELILSLANHVGDLGAPRETLAEVRAGITPAGGDATSRAVA